MPAAGADADSADLDVFDLEGLRDGDGEAFWVADAAGDALDEVGKGLRGGEGNEPAHAGGFEACCGWVSLELLRACGECGELTFDANDRMDYGAGVVG